MNKKTRFANLGASIEKQAAASHDRFSRADITMAIAATKGEPVLPAAPIVANGHSFSTEPPVQAVPESLSRLRTLAITIVKDHPRNARKLYDPARIDSMAKTIAREGQKVPVIVMRDPGDPDTFLLLEGRYRKRALLSLGRTEILTLEVDALDDLEAYRLSLLLNEERNDQTDLDNAMSWKEMLGENIFTSQRHICEQLGYTEAKVSKTLALLDLPESVMVVMKTNPAAFGLRVGYELRMLSKQLSDQEMETVVMKVSDGKMTVVELESLRIKRERPPTHRNRSRAYPLQFGDSKLGSIREFDDGRLNIELKGAPDHLRDAIKTAVQKVIAENAQSGESQG